MLDDLVGEECLAVSLCQAGGVRGGYPGEEEGRGRAYCSTDREEGDQGRESAGE
mgnify:CR=1 FL=1